MELEEITGRFPEFELFSEEERKAVMIVRSGRSEDAPVELMLRDIFVGAIVQRASDIHVVARGSQQKPIVGVSIRTPRGLVNWSYTGERGAHFQSKLFQLTATPQGGSTPEILSTRFSMELPERFARARGLQPREGRPYLADIRVEYVRTYDNWAFTCRLLDQQRAPKLHELGLNYALERSIDRALLEPSGLVLVSGPTGSGKTTLLNAMIDRLNDGQRSIVTIENPVEFRLEGEGPIKQIQVGGDITFARALRSVLRHDPDVILIGEIRDQETMEIALQGSQTGHLVLATLHANSAPETISRALDLTIDKSRDAYRLAETVRLVMAQRLLDRFDGVAHPRAVTHDEGAWLGANGMEFVTSIAEVAPQAKQGKAALIEAITMSPRIKDAIRADRLSVSEIYCSACDQPQYETLANAGVRAVQGLGCRLRDCMTRLESTTAAMTHPGLRARMAREHDLTMVDVAMILDELAYAEDSNRRVPVEDLIEQVKAQRREVQCAR